MKGFDANNLCIHGGDMLAYLYDEMVSSDREMFEVHLADCGTCIDDFAELSQSRYPVFEWKRSEFDPLPTPRIVIPFEAAVSVSWFQHIRTMLFVRPSLAFGGLSSAIVVAVITGYFIIGSPSRYTEVARDAEPKTSPSRTAVVNPLPADVSADQTSKPSKVLTEGPKATKVSTATKPPVRQPRARPVQQAKRTDAIPVMSSIDEDEDDSLRLADIFAEIGTS
ncbi:MAG: zf-HC2 domain-containing protein [Pyrinomonadaceae bacterium]